MKLETQKDRKQGRSNIGTTNNGWDFSIADGRYLQVRIQETL